MHRKSTIIFSTLNRTHVMTLHKAFLYLLSGMFGVIILSLIGSFYLVGYLNERKLQIQQDYTAVQNQYSVAMNANNELTEQVSDLSDVIVRKDKILESSDIFGYLLKKKKTNNIFASKELVAFSQTRGPTDEGLTYALDKVSESLNIMYVLPSGTPLQKDSYSYVSSSYGVRRHPIYNQVQFHHGIDMPLITGDGVITTAGGTVSFAGRRIGYGNSIIISHRFGFSTMYAHLHENLVKKGDIVQKGQLIAKGGNTGVSTGPHLHYEVRYLGRTVNPYYFYNWNLANFEEIFSNYKSIKWEQIVTAIKNDIQNLALQSSPVEQN